MPDWFRNDEWSPAIEEAFQQKLSRARTHNRAQYLVIQAMTLVPRHPSSSLSLLDQYFATSDTFEHSRAFQVRGDAFAALGQSEKAIESYKEGVEWERKFPNIISRSIYKLPFVIAKLRSREHYDLALSLLESGRQKLVFPIDIFLQAAALAFIYADLGKKTEAHNEAQRALTAAKNGKSPLLSTPRYRTRWERVCG